MAIIVTTDIPRNLLSSIKSAIDDDKIKTWSYDSAGDFTHTAEQWMFRAWLHPIVGDGELRFVILGRKSLDMTQAVYGVYHGRFIEMLLTHFDLKFSTARATAMPTSGDAI